MSSRNSLPVLKKILFASWCMTFLFTLAHFSQAEEQHTYFESNGISTKTFVWNLKISENTAEIESYQGEERYYCKGDITGATKEWIYENPKESIIIERAGEFLIFSGRRDGGRIDKKVQIDGSSWLQTLSYALRKFNETDQETIEFWHVRQDTLEPIKLTALKIGIAEDKKCNGRKAFRTDIYPTGLFSKLWKASYWFREGDSIFCRYEGRHGIPGTPLTVVSLREDDG